FKRGLERTRANRHAAAAAAYRAALKLDSANANAWNNLGWSLGQLGYLPQAAEMFERALRLNPNDISARSNLAWARGVRTGGTFQEAFKLQTSGRSAEAVPIYRELLSRSPGWVNAHYNLGYALMTLGDCPGAIAEFEQTLVLQPNYPVANLHLSTCLGKLGKKQDSVRHRAIYERSLPGRPPNIPPAGE
ncbi:MAG: tetratricopeptide repeat protein, partial [Gemmatimonadota bacterium]|nr:tetratricopeptide repeat protein [Gemmatimonadota bacterium]